MPQPVKPLTEDASEAAIRYIDMVEAEVSQYLTPLAKQYLENARTLLRGGKL